MSESTAKKNVQKLQRTIVDALDDVKAQDLQVFDTEHLSSLFERVIVASGTSNRQTKALAASVRDKVRDAGFAKPRIEGEDNGEWIIVDCGPVVAHIMQPAIRQYYNLEEIWGEKAVRLKHGADKKVAPAKTAPAKTTASKAKPKAAATPATQKPAAAKTRARTSASPAGAAKGAARSSSAAPARKRAPAAQGAATPSAARAVAKKSTSARKTPTRSATAPSAARKA